MNEIEDDLADEPTPVMLALREYQSALDAGSQPDRQGFLARHCEIADELAECIDGLEYLRAAAPGLSTTGTTILGPSMHLDGTLGDFRLIREIGRGGMGVVYEAEQISLRRRVALKVLPFAATLDSRQLGRFENEARAAAALHQSNIVPVFGVGRDRGVHYYAMQLIDGRALSEVIEDLRIAPTAGRPGAETVTGMASLTRQPTDSRGFFRTIAALGAQAADALDYAHQMGVVHRDVKPANLILDGRDHLWVTDFGLARIQSAPGATAPGDLIGTMRYMSPEQAGGEPAVDPRSDVYSLGATLYELLTLRPAFPAGDRRECLRQILEIDPAPLRRLNPAIPSELETIVLKAMAKSPGDRYATARLLAEDLRRFLDDRPVLARPPSIWERTRKWGRRHPMSVGVALLSLVFTCIGLAVSTTLIAREQARTHAAYDLERRRTQEAEERFRLARSAVDEMLQFSDAELANAPHLRPLRQRISEIALRYYQEFIELRSNDPAAQADLATTRDRVTRILSDLAVLQGAGQIFLVVDPAILQDLQVTKEQQEQLAELHRRAAERGAAMFREYCRQSPQARRERFLAEARTNEADMAAILNERQIARLRQIALQRQGLSAFQEPDVVAALQLTSDQRDRIRAIDFDAGFGRQSQPRSGKWALRRAQAVLTENQRDRWKAMVGAPVAAADPAAP